MNIESNSLLKNSKDFFVITIFLFVIFCFNSIKEYDNYKKLIVDDVFSTKARVLNIYNKKQFKILKLKSNNFIFYTRTRKDFKKNDFLEVLFISKYINFYDYIKGFFVKTLFITKKQNSKTINSFLSLKISKQHTNKTINEFFQAIFLAIPISMNLREYFSKVGISHLIAISGFHLGLFCFFIYNLLFFIYKPFHSKYFNYRNIKFDLLMVCSIFLLIYLVVIDFVPSFLRAFLMFILGIFFLRNNIKVLSFNTLFFTLILIISFNPKYLFSLSLWFSIVGVFYVYLFLYYFKDKSKIFIFLFFNIWIFLAMNPFIHYFFSITSYAQLLSFLVTLLFTIFYPVMLFLHIIGYGGLFDEYLIRLFYFDISSYDVSVSLSFVIFYSLISLLSVYKKIFFIILNILIVLFFIYIYI
ncbi:competence protein [Malaciobacter molluscorum]|uniref:ComEC/Rec2 family competence protein n=1 Tax=Malaciobacter molluscorum TaxID=1032072 RepID=UPI00100AFF3C|nr:ComEC/Rec2 family competence protein [Malaciobacter molluscorum]RXJ97290.1 competence protein [Malaciobacter molluscorum]